MSLWELGDKIKRSFSQSTSRTSEQRESSATVIRQDRAGNVAQLQQDVHRLQHEIADLSRSSETGAIDPDAPATDPQIDELQEELRQTQLSLAKLQGRI